MAYASKKLSFFEKGLRKTKLEVAMKSKKDHILTSRTYVEYERERNK